MKVRLNGWQRIWVILLFLHLVLVVGVTILFWPTPRRRIIATSSSR